MQKYMHIIPALRSHSQKGHFKLRPDWARLKPCLKNLWVKKYIENECLIFFSLKIFKAKFVMTSLSLNSWLWHFSTISHECTQTKSTLWRLRKVRQGIKQQHLGLPVASLPPPGGSLVLEWHQVQDITWPSVSQHQLPLTFYFPFVLPVHVYMFHTTENGETDKSNDMFVLNIT